MLPDPKKVARGVKWLLRSKEEKQRAIEEERDVQMRQGKNRIRRHVGHQKEMIQRLKALAKRSLAIGDEVHFRQLGKQLIWTEKDIQRWDKYLLTLEILEARRDQVRASVDLLQTVKSMSDSISDLAGAEKVGELQGHLEEGLARAETMEERIGLMMDALDSTLSEGLPTDESELSTLRQSLGDEINTQESAVFDKEIEEGLQRIRKELKETNL